MEEAKLKVPALIWWIPKLPYMLTPFKNGEGIQCLSVPGSQRCWTQITNGKATVPAPVKCDASRQMHHKSGTNTSQVGYHPPLGRDRKLQRAMWQMAECSNSEFHEYSHGHSQGSVGCRHCVWVSISTDSHPHHHPITYACLCPFHKQGTWDSRTELKIKIYFSLIVGFPQHHSTGSLHRLNPKSQLRDLLMSITLTVTLGTVLQSLREHSGDFCTAMAAG